MIKLVLEVIWGWAQARFILFYRHFDVDKGSMVVQWLAMLPARKLGGGISGLSGSVWSLHVLPVHAWIFLQALWFADESELISLI